MSSVSLSASLRFGWSGMQQLLAWPQSVWRGCQTPFAWLRSCWKMLWVLPSEKLLEADERGQFEETNILGLAPSIILSHDEPSPPSSSAAMELLEGPIFAHRVSDLPAMVVSGPTPNGTDEGSDASSPSPKVGFHRRRVHSVQGVGDRNGQEISHMGGHFAQGEEALDKEITDLQYEFFEARKEWPKEGNQYFIPANDLRSLVTVKTILNQLKYSRPDLRGHELRQMAEDACESAYKLFAILVCANKSNKFYEFLKEGICDADLPFRRSLDSGNNGYLCSGRDPDKLIQSMKSWGLYQVSNFSRDQWQMLSPIFRKSNEVEHYELQNNHVLPFIEDHEQESGKFTGFGGFSSVWAVVMHPDHQFLYKSTKPGVTNPRLAIKRLHSTEEKDFELEVEMLKAFSNHKDPHMIKLLATYRWRGKYHLIFPYARFNLRNYWEEAPTPEFSRNTIFWMLCQCKGIAASLYSIHEYKNSEKKQQATLGSDLPHRLANKENRFGRHGDIKPENILWSDEDVNHNLGLLLIADFGLMEFHREHSKSRVKPDAVVGSPTYAPPELELRLPISPAYDIWSLGCVFLEFITWLVIGLEELKGFSEARAFTNVDGLDNDTYFTILNEEGLKPRAIVRPGVTRWIKKIHRAPRCTSFVHEFLDLISNDMLVEKASDRIECGALNSQLAHILHKVQEDHEYLTNPAPWREDEHPTVSTDLSPSGRIFDSPPPSPSVGTALPQRMIFANLETRAQSLTWEPSGLSVNRTIPHRNSTIP